MKQIILSVVLFGYLQVSAAENLILLQFSSEDYSTTLSHLTELESKGVTARHIFPPNLAIVNAYDLPLSLLKGGSEDYTVYDRSDLLADGDLLEGISVRPAFLLPFGRCTGHLPYTNRSIN